VNSPGGAGVGPAVLVGAAISTALVHTLIPDHWLPFVLIGLARRWSGAKAAFWSGLSALIHISFSLALGLAGVAVGQGTAHAVGEGFERISGLLLVAFGIAYAFYAHTKGGHFHIGGERVHRLAGSAGHDHPHEHECPQDAEVADEALIRPAPSGKSPVYLAAIIGLNPCVLVLPLLVKSPQYGARAIFLTSIAYAVSTLLMMVGLVWFAVHSGRRLEMPLLHRHGEMISGLGIALVGAVFLFLEG
jgi:hypothetical protein